MKRLLSYLSPKMPWMLVYMLQQSEYSTRKFIIWSVKFPNLFQLQKRGKLIRSGRTLILLVIAYWGWLTGVLGMLLAFTQTGELIHIFRYILAPILAFVALILVNFILQKLIVQPKENLEIRRARKYLQGVKAMKIAVMGSYGKTTMKELLMTVLSEAKVVAATPGNKNVLISHARWINKQLTGKEEVLIFEYGEGKPGDIALLASLSNPNVAVVTGVAPAHLDEYASLEAIADDFSTIQGFVKPDDIYANRNSDFLKQNTKAHFYDQTGLDEWKVSDISVDFDGTSFALTNGENILKLKTGLLGAHQVGPLCTVVAIALRLGLSGEQIRAGVAKTSAFEHRMQARHLHGAWIIDDTYNGNIEGMRAGLELLKSLPGKRKIYVTPGLVDQGAESSIIHKELGELIAAAKPDKVVLMKNSVTEHIQSGLSSAGYGGEVQIEDNPLEYYTHLEHFLAAGDVIMLQNDWPDSYQ